MYSLIEQNNNIHYILNTNETTLYIYDAEEMKIEIIVREKWGSMNMNVSCRKKDETTTKLEALDVIIKNQNDFIHKCEIISSTLKPNGIFRRTYNNLERRYFNQFLGSEMFLECLGNPKYDNNQSIIGLLEKETPTIHRLIKNIFHNEKDEVIENFLAWLKVVAFKDTHQDIIWNFFGTNEEDQGQGAGKGVMITLLNKMFSGLVSSVSNTTYQNNFNSNLMNKKVIVFDEVDYKNLKYETIKDITGNPILRVEFKGREPLEAKNVSSWLMFSNMYRLFDIFGLDDRRTFLIRPNPKNGSLKAIINKDYGGDFNYFQTLLYSEIENFINIIAIASDKVKAPLEITTQAHKDYFKQSKQVSVLGINELHKILVSHDFQEKIFAIFQEIINITPSHKKDVLLIKKAINNKFMNRKIFTMIFDILKDNEYLNANVKLNQLWELFKENISKFDYVFVHKIKINETKKWSQFRDQTMIYHKDKTNKILIPIWREMFCTEA
jgi:hypothetical protein